MLRKFVALIVLGSSLALAGCSSGNSKSYLPSISLGGKKRLPSHNSKGESLAGFQGKGSKYFIGGGPLPKGGGKYHVGKPYQVAGKWFHPKEQPGYDRSGMASWYGEDFHARKTSNGEYFNMNDLTAAHPTLPLPSYARVTNLENGEAIVVRINDRGPFVGTRIIDLSKRSADTLGFKGKGKAKVRVQWIANAPINDNGNHLAMMNKKLAKGANMQSLIAAAGGNVRGDTQVAEVEPQPEVQLVSYQKKRKTAAKNDAQIVLIGSFKTLEGAESARAELETIGPVQVYEWQSDTNTLYKVQLGPFVSEIGAEEALAAVRDRGYTKAVLESTKIVDVAYHY